MSPPEKIHPQTRPSPPWLRLWLLFFSVLLVTGGALALWGKPGYALSAFGDLAELTYLLVAAVFMVRNAFNSHGSIRIFWLFSAAGIVFWIAGATQWAEYEIILRTSAPQTPVGDTLLFLKLVPLAAALAAQPQTELSGRFRLLGFLDMSFLLVYWFFFYAVWVIPYRYVVHEDGIYSFHFNTIDSIGHILFVAVLGIAALRAQGTWRVLYRVYWASFTLYALSSTIANVAIDEGKYYSGSLYDVPINLSVAGIAFFAVLGGRLPLGPGAPLPSRASRSSRVLVLLPSRVAMLATLSTPVVGFVLIHSGGTAGKVGQFRVLTTLFAMLILSGLLVVKQDLLSRDLVQSFRAASHAYDDLSRSHQRLLQTEKLASLGQVVARVANEVKKAMRVTLDSSSDLMTNPAAAPASRSTAEKIVTQAKRTDALLDNMLGFACESPLVIAPVDLRQLLTAAIGLTRAGRNIPARIEIHASEDVPTVAVDANRMLQVFVQVISNALDAMEDMGSASLAITLRNLGPQVEVEFADKGTGLLAPDHVFDPFYTTKALGKGIGLGLSTCYGIVRQHHGLISCRNREGGGAVFAVSLPVAHSGVPAPALTALASVEGS